MMRAPADPATVARLTALADSPTLFDSFVAFDLPHNWRPACDGLDATDEAAAALADALRVFVVAGPAWKADL